MTARQTSRARSAWLLAACAWAAASVTACASQNMPPGGPPDTAPPELLRVSPESGAVRQTPSAVTFRFDEVVSERPRGAPSLEGLVLISPSDGPPSVSWGRNQLTIRPRRGWRPNTAYSVTILPGLMDLRGNASKEQFRTVFATGDAIPDGIVRGAVFDWMAGKPAPGARIEATVGGDTLLRYSAAADTAGRFSLGSLPAGPYQLRAYIDQNSNGIRDTREAWDSVSLVLTDSTHRDLYMFVHDTLGARLADVSVTDGFTIRVRFDHGLRAALAAGQLTVMRMSDSTALRVTRIGPAAQADSAANKTKTARDDSLARADTSAKGRAALAKSDSGRALQVRDSIAKAQADTLRAARAPRDTVRRVPPPKLDRAIPVTEYVLTMEDSIAYEVQLRVSARAIEALNGPARNSDRFVRRSRPAPRDSTGGRRGGPPPSDPTTRRPPARDTTPARKPPPRDTLHLPVGARR